MGVKEFLRMSNGEQDTSYAQNSFNRSVISIAKPILEKAIEDLVNEGLPSNVLTIADLGCAFGPNTFTVITTIKRKVEKMCNELGVKQLELQVFLNDLPEMISTQRSNSFLKIINNLKEKGSARMVPPGLTSEVGIPINRGKIYISNTSPSPVSKAYLEQFQEDFTSFIKLRSKELILNARMVLILHGRQGATLP
ncbi:7-methylxanthine methyltransferase PCS1-like [Telopea speciosissima]|uniref:7-methylxanthine methyltransferase PCS1-like n=1 Tax=Telopea speciosissima TaxID=54955 RepID=UPI001CC6A878|nr:7-methylxanthine methyltransferase PCS1-like [Telopea speciosissima]